MRSTFLQQDSKTKLANKQADKKSHSTSKETKSDEAEKRFLRDANRKSDKIETIDG